MQMKMDKKAAHRFDKQHIRKILETEDEFITTLFDSFEVPDTVKDDDKFDEQFLLKSKAAKGLKKFPSKQQQQQTGDNQSAVDMQQRLETIRNKMKSKKSKPSDRAIQKKQQKKLKKTKELKKKLISVAKSIKNEKIKEEKGTDVAAFNGNGVDLDVKPDIKPDVKPVKVFNEEGKMVFSKFSFAAQPSQAKKSKKDKSIKNPKLILQKLKQEKQEINELIEQGDVGKAEQIKKDMAWKKAFDKSDGKKVKDNATLLHKTIHRKKVEKKKSKEDWKKRSVKVEKDKETKAKKRESNINKKKDEKKKHKLKKSAQRGRIIAGY